MSTPSCFYDYALLYSCVASGLVPCDVGHKSSFCLKMSTTTRDTDEEAVKGCPPGYRWKMYASDWGKDSGAVIDDGGDASSAPADSSVDDAEVLKTLQQMQLDISAAVERMMDVSRQLNSRLTEIDNKLCALDKKVDCIDYAVLKLSRTVDSDMTCPSEGEGQPDLGNTQGTSAPGVVPLSETNWEDSVDAGDWYIDQPFLPP